VNLGYFDKKAHKDNQKWYPNLALLDAKVSELLASEAAKEWDPLVREVMICNIHPVYWMENYGHIKEGELAVAGEEEEGTHVGVRIIPFKLNTSQMKIADKICGHILAKPWTRAQYIILKHRKAGISTLIAAFDYWFIRVLPNIGGFCIADLGSHTDNIMEMVLLFHQQDTCGRGLGVKFQPPGKVPMTKNKKGIRLSNGSMIEQDSGENSNPGTSGTVNLCHMSENAKWRDPDNAETSLLNSVPRRGFVFIVKESTAFGMNKYALDCENAEKGVSNWGFIFLTWKDLPDCEYELGPGEELEYTEKERELVATYKLTPGHIKFRRSQIELLDSEQKFQQDFPLNSREPFLVTGSNFFDIGRVQERMDEIKFFRDWKTEGWEFVTSKYPEIHHRAISHPRGLREALSLMEDRNVVPTYAALTMNDWKVSSIKIEAKDKRDEHLTIYHPAIKGRKYLVTVDVAEGLMSDDYTSDDSSIEVWDVYRMEQVAEWSGTFDEEITGFFSVMIAKLYNDALIAPEMNNKCGGLLQAHLEKTGYRRFYKRTKVNQQRRVEDFGWLTTVGNKKDVCGVMKIEFKNGNALIHSLSLLEEMMFFVDSKGKLQATSGHKDDRVMSASINLKIISITPEFREPPVNQRSRWPTGPSSSSFQTLEREQNRDRQKAAVIAKYR